MDAPDRLTQFAQYLERRAPGRRTTILYVSDVRQFAAAIRKPWREMTMQDIDTFVDQQRQAGLSAATVKRRVAALKVFFYKWRGTIVAALHRLFSRVSA